MARGPKRQVTPPAWRVWTFGVGGTAAASLLTYCWAYLCDEVWHWPIQVPKLLDAADLVTASYQRIIVITVVVGLLGTSGAALLARMVIGPRIWWLIVSTGLGLTSLYGALTVPGTDLAVRLRLSVLHILVMLTLIPAISAALRISDDDVSRTLRAHQPVDTQPPASTLSAPAAAPVSEPGSSTDTLILPPEA